MDNWWHSPDCVYFYWGIVHNFSCGAYDLGILFLEKVHGPKTSISLSSLVAMSDQDEWGIHRSRCAYVSLGIPGALDCHNLGVTWFTQLASMESCLEFSRHLQNLSGLILPP